MNKTLLISALVIIVVGTALYFVFFNGKDSTGSQAPDFVSQDISGNEIKLSSFIGEKPVLLVFWATWCKFCAQELPHLKEFYRKHKDEVSVIVIPSGEVKRVIEDYVKEKDIDFLVILDEQKEIWNTYAVRGTPAHFLIDKEGKIFTMWPGLADLDNLETMLSMVK